MKLSKSKTIFDKLLAEATIRSGKPFQTPQKVPKSSKSSAKPSTTKKKPIVRQSSSTFPASPLKQRHDQTISDLRANGASE
jgi:hypothetical protein